MAICKFCGTEVTWVKEGRKNVPVENDGGTHKCERFESSRNSIKKLTPDDIDPEILKQYQENMQKELDKKKKKNLK